MKRQMRASLIAVAAFSLMGSPLAAQSAAGNAPPASVTRENDSVGRNFATEAAARLGVSRVDVPAPASAGAVASTGQTVKWVLIIIACVVLLALGLAISDLSGA